MTYVRAWLQVCEECLSSCWKQTTLLIKNETMQLVFGHKYAFCAGGSLQFSTCTASGLLPWCCDEVSAHFLFLPMSNVANSRQYEQQRMLEDLNGQSAEIRSNPFKNVCCHTTSWCCWFVTLWIQLIRSYFLCASLWNYSSRWFGCFWYLWDICGILFCAGLTPIKPWHNFLLFIKYCQVGKHLTPLYVPSF